MLEDDVAMEWRPTEAEVRRILEELRPLIARFAARERFRIEVTRIISAYS